MEILTILMSNFSQGWQVVNLFISCSFSDKLINKCLKMELLKCPLVLAQSIHSFELPNTCGPPENHLF